MAPALALLLCSLSAAPAQAEVSSLDLGEGIEAAPLESLASGSLTATHLDLSFAAPQAFSALRVRTCAPTTHTFAVRIDGSATSANAENESVSVLRFELGATARTSRVELSSWGDADGAHGDDPFCLAQLELLSASGHAVPVVPQASALALERAAAACVKAHPRGVTGEPLSCSPERPEFRIPGHELAKLVAESRADGEGSSRHVRYVLLEGEAPPVVLEVNAASSGEGPGNAHSERLVVCASASHGVPLLEVHGEDSTWGLDEAGRETSTSSQTLTRYTWSGEAFEATTPARPCDEPPKAVKPRWLDRATATSQLRDEALDADFYAPSRAVDGLPGTAWAEGAKSNGIGEALTLHLAAPLAIKGLRLLAGCGTTDALWKANERVRVLRVSFSDGSLEQFELPDARRGQWQRVELQRTTPTTALQLGIEAVYPGRFTDGCLSEVVVEPR